MIRQTILLSILSTIAIAAAVFASPTRSTPVNVIGSELSFEELQKILGTGDCDDIGPPQGCGEEEYCKSNGCTGQPYPRPGGGPMVKDCNIVNQHNIVLIWPWYWLYMTGMDEGYESVSTGEGDCRYKCNCDDYCYDVSPPELPAVWECGTTDNCVETGHFIDALSGEGESTSGS